MVLTSGRGGAVETNGQGVMAPPGLRGLLVAETTIGDVRGREGFFHYRQYDAVELARRRSFEDVWHLILRGHLPSAEEAAAFGAEVRAARSIPAGVGAALDAIAALPEAAPLSGLRAVADVTAVALGFPPAIDARAEDLQTQAVRISAVLPTLAAALHRLRRGARPIDPDPDLNHAENYLFLLSGERPDADRARALEQYWIATLEHGFNASTFTARIIASTRSDLGSAVVGALGALAGPLHGGAPGRVWEMLDDIGAPGRADAWLRARLDADQRLMGFGHAVYRTEDPRSRLLGDIAQGLGGSRVDLALHVEERALALLRELRPGHELYTNVEFYASVVLEAVGLPPAMFTPTFALSRVVGWTAHVLEQLADHRIVRPGARYVGPEPPVPVPDPA
jgi:citrate synthase